MNLLIAQYGIAENRIDADGNGVGNFFREAEWNSVAICSVYED
jgi:ompA family protein